MSGAVSYYGGLAAEEQVAAKYLRHGFKICKKRWRGRGGEIDLIARDDQSFVFVEVKKARDIARAVERITPRQMRRVSNAANEYLATTPAGIDAVARIDVALVNEVGEIEIIENAFGH